MISLRGSKRGLAYWDIKVHEMVPVVAIWEAVCVRTLAVPSAYYAYFLQNSQDCLQAVVGCAGPGVSLTLKPP